MQIFLIILVCLVFFVFVVIPLSLYIAFIYTSLPFYLFAQALEVSYTKLDGSLSTGITLENASSEWLSLKRLDISFDYDEELKIIYFRKIIAEDGVIDLPKGTVSKGNNRKRDERHREPSSDDQYGDQSEQLPTLHVENVKIRNIRFRARENYTLDHLIVKEFILGEDELDLKKFSFQSENLRLAFKKATKKLFVYGWHRENIDQAKQKVRIMLSQGERGDKKVIVKSSWFDAALYYTSLSNQFEFKYIRRLDKNQLKFPPISKFKYDFGLDQGELHIGKNRFKTRLNSQSGIVFESTDKSFPLYFDVDGFKFGLIGRQLSSEQLGELWFGQTRLSPSQKTYLSDYVVVPNAIKPP
ncbi:MAG: hypothetical protein HRU09_08005 [Oligoflexales bacterium]|nr:hypothetical protein [Oligoflexales bacterium]